MESDMSQDENEYQPLPSVAELFGELDNDVPTFQDQPQVPGKRSSAARHAARRKANDLDAAMEGVDDVIDQARTREAEAAAYDRVMSSAKPSTADKIAAARYAKAQGIVQPRPTAERLAGPTLDRRHREGQRPRS
jgi:hypothetical protein